MANFDPILRRDFRAGRITPETLSPYLVPENSVKDSLNINFDEIVGSGKVRPGTTQIGTGQHPGADGFMPQGLTEFVSGSGAGLSPEKVTNGSFTGSASGWTLGDGWSYGTNNALWTPSGSELVTNGSFTGSATGWSLGTGWSYASNHVATTGSVSGTLSQSIAVTAGKTYTISIDILTTNNGALRINQFTSSVFLTNLSAGTTTTSFPVITTSPGFSFQPTTFGGTAFVGSIDNISVKLLNEGTLSQDINAISNQTYQVSVTATGSVGYVVVSLGGTDSFVVAAGSTVTQNLTAGSTSISISSSTDFNGAVDNVSAKQIFNSFLLVVYNGVSAATLYYWNGSTWTASGLTTLTNDAKDRFTVFGSYAFVTNSEDGMFSSPDAANWSSGAAANCIPAADAKPAYIFRYKQRLLAAGDPTYPDRVYFSSIIDPSSSPFITWNTDPATGDWIDVNPDDGGNVTGFSENSTFCLVFKNTGMYRMDTVAKTTDPDNIYNVGAVSQEAITLCQGVTYFFSGTGVYRTNGGYPELISRNGVQDIINAMDPADWDNVASGTDGFNVWFELGSVLFHKNQSNERRIDNVVIKFSVRDQSWSVHAYRDYFGMFCQYTDGNGDLMRGASDAGIVQTIDLGKTDITDAIPFFLETQDIDCGDRSHNKGISDKIAVFTDDGLSSSFSARLDGNPTPVPILLTLEKRVNVGQDINLQANFYNFIWSGTSSGNPPIFEGFKIEDIQDLGMGDAQGSSQAPIVTTPLT